MPKTGTPDLHTAFIFLIISVFSEGSPGPFESMMPSGLSERISSALEAAGTRMTRSPRFVNSRSIFAFAPKSHRTTRSALPFFSEATESFTSSPPYDTACTALIILNDLILFKSAAFARLSLSAFRTASAASESPETSSAFITPASLSTFVKERVSISYRPTTPFFFNKESSVPSLRKFEGTSHFERTT